MKRSIHDRRLTLRMLTIRRFDPRALELVVGGRSAINSCSECEPHGRGDGPERFDCPGL